MIAIRKINKEDNEALALIIRSAFDELGAPKQGTVYDDPTTDNLYQAFIATDRAALWVAEEDGRVIGCCGVYPTPGLPQGWCEIVKFYVDNQTRGKGAGRMLFLKSLESAKEMGYQTAYLETFTAFANAVGMYRRLGFNDLKQQMGNSGHLATNIWMIKEL